MKVLTVELPDMTYEVHMLNPKDHMPGFGGSRSGLLVSDKTASLILRQNVKGGGIHDSEHDIHDPRVWEAIAKWINDTRGVIKAKTA